MCALVVLGFCFHTKPRDWLGERLRNDLFCVQWDVKPQLNQSIINLLLCSSQVLISIIVICSTRVTYLRLLAHDTNTDFYSSHEVAQNVAFMFNVRSNLGHNV